MTSRQLKNPYGFFAPYIPMPKGRGFTARLVNRVEILKSPVPLYPAYKMAEIISRFSIEIALLCVPEDAAQHTAENLAAAGIRGILNFTPVVLTTPPETAVRNVGLLEELRALSIEISNKVILTDD
ncbi:MAG: hypothetical protein LBD29_08055 [Treponema sp.]|jgi:redox-sensing transcriptional repressor|nr:hypothetical protein [Treponema sp.]